MMFEGSSDGDQASQGENRPQHPGEQNQSEYQVPDLRQISRRLKGEGRREHWRQEGRRVMEDRAHRHWVEQLLEPARVFDHQLDTFSRPAYHTHLGTEYLSQIVSQPEPGDWDTPGINNKHTREVLRIADGMGGYEEPSQEEPMESTGFAPAPYQ